MEISSIQICDELLACFKRFKLALMQLAESYDLTAMQLFAMHAIQQGATTMGQIATVLQCDASNVTGIVDRLVAQSLIIRQESPQDRRAKILQLTAKGQKVVEDIERKMPELIGCDKLQQAERAALHAIVAKIA